MTQNKISWGSLRRRAVEDVKIQPERDVYQDKAAGIAQALAPLGYTQVLRPLVPDIDDEGVGDKVRHCWLLSTYNDLQVLYVVLEVGTQVGKWLRKFALAYPDSICLVDSVGGAESFASIKWYGEYRAGPMAFLLSNGISSAFEKAAVCVEEGKSPRRPSRVRRGVFRFLGKCSGVTVKKAALDRLWSDEEFFTNVVISKSRRPFEEAMPALRRIAVHPLVEIGNHRRKARAVPHANLAAFRGDINEVVEINLRLALAYAGKRAKHARSLLREDLFHHGVLGLMRAAELFEPERGLQYSTYATPWVKQRIGRAMANTDHMIRKPVHIVQELSWSDPVMKRVARMTVHGFNELNLEIMHAPAAEEPLNASIYRERKLRLLRAIRNLKPRERYVLVHRYGLLISKRTLTLEETAARYGVTRERVRQIQMKAEEKLSVLLNSRSGNYYLVPE